MKRDGFLSCPRCRRRASGRRHGLGAAASMRAGSAPTRAANGDRLGLRRRRVHRWGPARAISAREHRLRPYSPVVLSCGLSVVGGGCRWEPTPKTPQHVASSGGAGRPHARLAKRPREAGHVAAASFAPRDADSEAKAMGAVHSKKHLALAGPRRQRFPRSRSPSNQMALTTPMASAARPRHQRVLPARPACFPESPPLQRDLWQPEIVNPRLSQTGTHAAANHAREVVFTLSSASIGRHADVFPQSERQALGGNIGKHVSVPVLKVPLGCGLRLRTMGSDLNTLDPWPVIVQ